MEPITIAMLFAGAALLGVAFWAYVQEFLQDHVIPFVRQVLGVEVAEGLTNLVMLLDKVAVNVRRGVKSAWRSFKENVLKSTEVYDRKGAVNTVRTRTTFARNDAGQVMKRVETQEVSWDDVPEDVRKVMMAQGVRKASIDIKAKTVEHVEKQAADKDLLQVIS